uniref:PDZ domain-containing protein n=1 Tax=Noctiluca scintillans TaxID=2966 RepID=A0A7S1FKE9_NOCSC
MKILPAVQVMTHCDEIHFHLVDENCGGHLRVKLSTRDPDDTLSELTTSSTSDECTSDLFRVLVERRHGMVSQPKLGIVIRQLSRGLVVQNVGQGMISAWNDEHPETALRVGDELLSVNGVSGPPWDFLLRPLAHANILNILARRQRFL